MTAAPEESVEEDATICPACGLVVSFKWATGERGGFVSEPHNVLVADNVFHAECWKDWEQDPKIKEEKRDAPDDTD